MCYRFELIEFDDGLFKEVDATYILHLEGNGRLDHIYKQLDTYHPSNKVYIVYNKGYNKCPKKLHMQSVAYDIIDANMEVFKHAKQYNHILVLEDDFLFSEKVSNHTRHVDTFLKRDTSFVYQLGSNPLIALPIDMYHYRVFGVLAHANIYSSLSRKQLINDYNNNKIKGDLGCIDSYISKVLPIYMYYKPLCYQTFPMTDNRKTWYKNRENKLAPFAEIISDKLISWTNLDHEPEPGFSIMYFIAKSIPVLLLLLILWVISHFSYLCKIKPKRMRSSI